MGPVPRPWRRRWRDDRGRHRRLAPGHPRLPRPHQAARDRPPAPGDLRRHGAGGRRPAAARPAPLVRRRWLPRGRRRQPQNIVIGGAAGAFPPLVGWAAVTGRIDLPALVIFAIIFFWTPPHFWALALLKRRDYEKAGVPMLPVVAGEPATRRQIFIY